MKYRVEIRRNNIREQPYIVQEKWYITPQQKLMLNSLRVVIAEESTLPKNIRNQDLIKTLEAKCNEITQGYNEKYEIFSNDGLYFQCIGKYVETSDGWMITKKL